MNQDEIIRMAREAGMQLAWIATVPGPDKMKVLCNFDQAQRFAALVAAAEREAICPIVFGLCVSDNNAQEIVNAIRARGQE